MKSRLLGNVQLVAGKEGSIPLVFEMLEAEGFETNANPDLYVRTYTSFGIEEARELRTRAHLASLGERRVFIITAPDIGREAQNALLKLTEEAPGDALFFFIVPAPATLLPAFRSRAQFLELSPVSAEGALDSRAFLAASPEKRLDMLKGLLEKGADDKRDLGAILSFLATLEAHLQKEPAALEPVYRARKYITDKGALVKPLLEQVALLVPRV